MNVMRCKLLLLVIVIDQIFSNCQDSRNQYGDEEIMLEAAALPHTSIIIGDDCLSPVSFVWAV